MAMTSDAHDDAVLLMETAIAAQDRLGERYRSALGTPSEFGAYGRLRVATSEVEARQASLKAIDHDSAGGPVRVNGWIRTIDARH
jgi:hypothetical protein